MMGSKQFLLTEFFETKYESSDLTVADDYRVFPSNRLVGDGFCEIYREKSRVLEVILAVRCFEEDFGFC